MRTVFIFFMLWMTALQTLVAQESEGCGTHYSTKNLDNYKALIQASHSESVASGINAAINYVPVHFHITRLQNGNGYNGYSISDQTNVCDAALDVVNTRYKSANLQFYRCLEPDVILDDSLFTGVQLGTARQASFVGTNFNPSVINIFLTSQLFDTDSSTLCGVSRFPWDSDRFLILTYDCLENGSSFPHELGHYFGLLHTHETANGKEHVERNSGGSCYNCGTTGDLLCDTPADPQLSNSNVDNSCNYTGTATDACSVAYVPDPSNIMSYSRKQCRNTFSAGQVGVIMSSYLNTRQAQLDNSVCNQTPCFEDVSLPNVTVLSSKKVNAEKTITSEEIIMTPPSEDVQYNAGEAIYLKPGFHAMQGVRFWAYIDGCFIPPFAPDWVDDRQYASPYSLSASDMKITPNPASDVCTISCNLEVDQGITLRVTNMQGQVLQRRELEAQAPGNLTQIQIDCSKFPPGMYTCILESGTLRKMARFIVSR